MPKQAFPAAAEGTPIFSRRTFLQGMGSAGIVAGIVVAPAAAEAYQAAYGPEERLRHHLLMAGQAMDELVPDSDSRWLVTFGGKAPFESRFINAQRFQLMPDPEIKGLMIERMHDVMRWQP